MGCFLSSRRFKLDDALSRSHISFSSEKSYIQSNTEDIQMYDSLIQYNDLIYTKEQKLQLYSCQISEIRDAFFNLSKQNNINYAQIMTGLSHLGCKFSGIDKQIVLNPFFSAFSSSNIQELDCESYNFRNILSIFFLISNNNTKAKALAIFRLFDYANSSYLSQNEIEYMFYNIFYTVVNYSQNLLEADPNNVINIKKQDDNAKLELIINRINKKIINSLVSDANNNKNDLRISEHDFIQKINNIKENVGYNPFKTEEIRSMIDFYDKKIQSYVQVSFQQDETF